MQQMTEAIMSRVNIH